MYDFTDLDLSNQMMDVSNGFWTQSIDLNALADQYWIEGQTEMYQHFNAYSEQSEWYSQQLEDAAWQAYYGPVNSEGYTAYDASHGYTTSDTSLIEPAASASSMSLISDNNASSWL